MNDDLFDNPRHLDEDGEMIYELTPEELVELSHIGDPRDILCDECESDGAVTTLYPIVSDEERAKGPRRQDIDVCLSCRDKLLATGDWAEEQ